MTKVQVLGQEIVVETLPDTLGRIVSVLALVVAVGTAWFTFWQGRAIRRIETTEHEWQKVDRTSASVEVTAHHFQETYVKDDRVVHSRQDWLRLRNSGRALAREIEWSAENDSLLLGERRSLEELHPGEHFDIYFAMTLADAPGWMFTVVWIDERGRQATQRRIS